MSQQASYWARDQSCSTATEKAILMVIANYVDPDGICHTSQDILARQACCSVKSVKQALQAFEGRGWLTKPSRPAKHPERPAGRLALSLTSRLCGGGDHV